MAVHSEIRFGLPTKLPMFLITYKMLRQGWHFGPAIAVSCTDHCSLPCNGISMKWFGFDIV